MHTARSARPTHSPSLSAVEYTATASAPRSWQARTRRTAASPRFAIRTRRSMGWLIPWGAWMLGAGWGALDVGSVRRAGWMMPWPRTIVTSSVSQTWAQAMACAGRERSAMTQIADGAPRSSWNQPSGRSVQRERQLPPRRSAARLDRADPLHPPEATAAGHHQPRRAAVRRRQIAAVELGGTPQLWQVGHVA